MRERKNKARKKQIYFFTTLLRTGPTELLLSVECALQIGFMAVWRLLTRRADPEEDDEGGGGTAVAVAAVVVVAQTLFEFATLVVVTVIIGTRLRF